MDLDRLKEDWENDPQLKYLAFKSVEELAAHLNKAHAEMMGGKHGCLGYLYRRQTDRVRSQSKS